jgi:hypothetical protein
MIEKRETTHSVPNKIVEQKILGEVSKLKNNRDDKILHTILEFLKYY